MAYKIAASMALKAAAKQWNKPVILERMMTVEATAPNEYLGSVVRKYTQICRGAIVDEEEVGKRHHLLKYTFLYLKCLDMLQILTFIYTGAW